MFQPFPLTFLSVEEVVPASEYPTDPGTSQPGISESEEPDTGYTDCYGCSSMATRWQVTFSGITGGSCADCSALNATHVLDRSYLFGYCRWRKTLASCSGINIDFARTASATQLIVIRGTAYAAVYTLSGAFNCNGANTLNLTATNATCSNWASTITISPA